MADGGRDGLLFVNFLDGKLFVGGIGAGWKIRPFLNRGKRTGRGICFELTRRPGNESRRRCWASRRRTGATVCCYSYPPLAHVQKVRSEARRWPRDWNETINRESRITPVCIKAQVVIKQVLSLIKEAAENSLRLTILDCA